jgi:hypothetical protein
MGNSNTIRANQDTPNSGGISTHVPESEADVPRSLGSQRRRLEVCLNLDTRLVKFGFSVQIEIDRDNR